MRTANANHHHHHHHHLVPATPPLAHAISGSLGSALALFLLYPLERVRTELQSSSASTSTTLATPIPAVGLAVSAAAAAASNLDFEHQAASDDPQEEQNHIAASSSSGRSGRSSPHGSSTGSVESWVTLTASEHEEHEEHGDDDDDDDDDERIMDPIQFPTAAMTAAQSPQRGRETLIQCLIRLHVQKQLYTGVGPVVTTMGITNFVFFFAHSAFQKLMITTSATKRMTTSRALMASTLAGIVNVLLTNPLWVANLRIIKNNNNNINNHNNDHNDHKRHSSLWSELKQIVKQEGLPSLWSGTLTSLLLVSNPVIQFFCYEQLKQMILLQSLRKHLGNSNNVNSNSNNNNIVLQPIQAFCLGALAKALATVVTYPLQLAQLLLRLPNNQYKGTMDCLLRITKEQGSTALFVGLYAKMLQTTLTAALQFLSYEQILNVVRTTLFSTRL